MELFYDVDYVIPNCVFVSGIAPLQLILDSCGVRGIIHPPERRGPKRVRFHIEW